MITEKFQNSPRIFRCETCDYSSVRKSQYERHCNTDKHIKRVMVTDDNDLVPDLFNCECGKIYKYRSVVIRRFVNTPKMIYRSTR